MEGSSFRNPRDCSDPVVRCDDSHVCRLRKFRHHEPRAVSRRHPRSEYRNYDHSLALISLRDPEWRPSASAVQAWELCSYRRSYRTYHADDIQKGASQERRSHCSIICHSSYRNEPDVRSCLTACWRQDFYKRPDYVLESVPRTSRRTWNDSHFTVIVCIHRYPAGTLHIRNCDLRYSDTYHHGWKYRFCHHRYHLFSRRFEKRQACFLDADVLLPDQDLCFHGSFLHAERDLPVLIHEPHSESSDYRHFPQCVQYHRRSYHAAVLRHPGKDRAQGIPDHRGREERGRKQSYLHYPRRPFPLISCFCLRSVKDSSSRDDEAQLRCHALCYRPDLWLRW